MLIPMTPAYHQDEGDQQVWEDVLDTKTAAQTTEFMRRSTATPNSFEQVKTRQRKARAKSPSSTSSSRTLNSAVEDQYPLESVATDVSQNAVMTTMSNLHTTLGWLRKSMTLLVILWVFGYIFTNLPPDVIRPLCVYPLFSHTSRCRLKEPKTFYADFPEMMGIQSRTFEHLLDESIGGSSLAIEIKNAEMSMRELVSLVKISDLTSKDLLASSMSEFVKDAKRTGVGLQDLTAKIHGSVDDILAINEYAMRSIEAAKGEPEESLPWPFMGMAKSSVEVARRSFDHVFLTLSTSIDDLVAEAQRSLNDLDNLEERLNTMNDIVTREDKSLSKKHKDLLASIWYKVGRGKVEKEQFEEDLAVLKNVGTYRKRAVDYVMNAMNELGKIKADMKVLRGKVRSPAITRGIPMEVQLESIRSGVMKLKQKSINAREQEQVAYKNFKARKNS